MQKHLKLRNLCFIILKEVTLQLLSKIKWAKKYKTSFGGGVIRILSESNCILVRKWRHFVSLKSQNIIVL